MIKQFREIEPDEYLVAGYDMASGVKDYCAVQFVSYTKCDVPVVIHSDKTASEVTNQVVEVLEQIYRFTGLPPMIAPETNAGGVFEIDRMLAMNRLNHFRIYEQPTGIGSISYSSPRKYGWTTSSATRPRMLSDLKQAIDNRIIKIYDRNTVSEMYSFVVVKGTSVWKAQAESNSHDDLLIALAIGWQLYLQAKIPEVTQDKQMYGANYENVNVEDKKWRIGG